MKSFISRTFTIAVSMVLVFACTSKKQENNIKSLERRIAELENKSNTTTQNESAGSDEESNMSEYAQMTFEMTEYDFGSVKEGDIVDYTFKFTNTGENMLVISKATATCGCTVPEWPKEPIKPGESGEIRVKFDSKGRKDLQTKYVNINANTKPEVTRLKLSGNVVSNEDSNS
ncbi:MAG: DUF1573 domain-containing protein [Cyclobacteriaceae bacterium]|nr:DUF1573 domain-containing protein [Cyclobacteriaceae bacterium]